MPRRVTSVRRTVYFYRLVVPGRAEPPDLRAALGAVERLSFAERQRYIDLGDGQDIACWVAEIGTKPRVLLATNRRTAWPRVESEGERFALELSRPVHRPGISEATHAVLFEHVVDDRPWWVAGIEYNHYGPRPARLAHYLAAKAASVCRGLVGRPLVDPDVGALLTSLQRVRLVEFRVTSRGAEALSTANEGWRAACTGVLGTSGIGKVAVTLSPSEPRGWLERDIPEVLRGLVNAGTEGIDLLRVKGLSRASKMETIDLLKSVILSEIRPVRADPTSRELDSDSAFSAIEMAYDRVSDRIGSALEFAADENDD